MKVPVRAGAFPLSPRVLTEGPFTPTCDTFTRNIEPLVCS
jgi:hypothetical protein